MSLHPEGYVQHPLLRLIVSLFTMAFAVYDAQLGRERNTVRCWLRRALNRQRLHRHQNLRITHLKDRHDEQ